MSLVNVSRRGFLRSAVTLLAAPAIVRVASLMPVRAFVDDGTFMPTYGGFWTIQVYRSSPLKFLIDESWWERRIPIVKSLASAVDAAG